MRAGKLSAQRPKPVKGAGRAPSSTLFDRQRGDVWPLLPGPPEEGGRGETLPAGRAGSGTRCLQRGLLPRPFWLPAG